METLSGFILIIHLILLSEGHVQGPYLSTCWTQMNSEPSPTLT